MRTTRTNPRLTPQARDLAALLTRWSKLSEELEELWDATPPEVLENADARGRYRDAGEMIDDIELYLSRVLAAAIVGRS